jgi:hypothetical protein
MPDWPLSKWFVDAPTVSSWIHFSLDPDTVKSQQGAMKWTFERVIARAHILASWPWLLPFCLALLVGSQEGFCLPNKHAACPTVSSQCQIKET